jgi:hypothetical protein
MTAKYTQHILTCNDVPKSVNALGDELVKPATLGRDYMVVHQKHAGHICLERTHEKIKRFGVGDGFCVWSPIQTDELNAFVNERDIHQKPGWVFGKKIAAETRPVIMISRQAIQSVIVQLVYESTHRS